MVAAAVDTPEKMVGRPIKRREDPRLITGAGNYLDDVRLPGMTYAALVRSPHAHARIVSVDTSAAATMPGVIGVFTGDDFMDVNPLPAAWQAAGVKNNAVTPRVIAVNEVHQTGDPVAVVVAETLLQATDAAEPSPELRLWVATTASPAAAAGSSMCAPRPSSLARKFS